VIAPTITTAEGAGAVTESAQVAFAALSAGQTLTLAGLTFTAGVNGASAAQVAGAFENLQNGATTGNGTLVANGSGFYQGTFSGWTTSSASSNNVTFTSTSANTNVSDLAPATTATAPVISITQGQIGITETYEVTFADMKAGQTLTIANYTYTADADKTGAQVATLWANKAAGTGTEAPFTGTLTYATATAADGNKLIFTGNPTLSNVADLTVEVGGLPSTVTASGGQGGRAESAAVTFNALAAGAIMNLGGLIFTAGAAGATATQVAQAFQNLTSGATTGDGTSYGTYSGALTGYSTGSAAGGSSITFTSTSPATNVTNLAMPTTITVAISTAEGSLSSTEVATVDFSNGAGGDPTSTNALTSGQTISIAGLTFTANGNVTRTSLAAAFSNLQNGATAAQLNASGQSAYGSFSGTFTGWSTGAVINQRSVAFTSATPNTNVTNLVTSPLGTLASGPTITEGIAASSEQATVTFKDLKQGQTLTIAGLTLTAVSNMSASQVALAFQNLTNGMTFAEAEVTANTSLAGNAALGNFTAGTFSGWSTSAASTASVSFNSAVAATNVTDLVATLGTGSAAITSTTQGQINRTEAATVIFNALSEGQSLSLAGVTFTAQSNLTAAQVAAKFTSGAIAAGGLGYSGALAGYTAANAVTGTNSDNIVFTSTTTNLNVTDLTAAVAGTAPTIITTNGGSTNSTETANVTFNAANMAAGDSVTLAGLTFTAGANGATRAQVAAAFSNLAAGTSSANLSSANGTFSGTLTGWSTGASNGTGLTATSSTASQNVQNLTASATQRSALNALSGIVVGGLANQTGENLLTLRGTVNGNTQTQQIKLKDNAANNTQILDFNTFGIQFAVDSFQAQSASDIGAALASLNSSSPSYGTSGAFKPGQIVVGQGANSALKFQSGADSEAFIQIDTLNIQTGKTGISAGSDATMMAVGDAIAGTATGNLGGLGVNDSINSWQTAFRNASAAVDAAIDYISSKRATFGSQMSRLGFITTNLTAQSTNLQNSRSAIIDTDFASETAKLTKGQIMQQAATAMLAQANQMPNVILSLLK